MKKLLFILLSLFAAHRMPAREYVDLHQPNPQDDPLVQAAMASSLPTIALSCTYQSVDVDGNPVTLSGKVYMPRAHKAQRIILQAHFTILSHSEAPSETDVPDAMLRYKDYVLVLPDYLGFGVSHAHKHPYLCPDITARNCADMLIAVQGFLQRLDREPLHESVVLVGYSQGGQTIIATQRLLETQHPDIPILRCYAGAGPYDLGRTYDVSIQTDNVGLPFTVPMLIMGTSWGHNLNLDLAYFLKPKAANRAEKYLFSKKYSAVDVTLLKRMGFSNKVSDLMTREGMDKTQPETRRFYNALVQSSIAHVDETDTVLGDWTPRAPIYLFHSRQDKSVVFENALSLQLMLDAKGARVEYDFGDYGDHIQALFRFFDYLNREL
ncbi:MAG: hypothetical protein IKN59_08970 [Paludibacteraceae bacterium]|nr:hypothetical protein [Paludibacteraceae bacterium]